MFTHGLSPKVLRPLLAQLLAIAANAIGSGGPTKIVLAQALTALGTLALGYLSHPGTITDQPGAAEPAHPEAG